jgi:hypothetical protein
MGTAQSFIDPSQLIQNSIGDKVQGEMRTGTQQNLAVQPAESEKAINGEPK